MCPYFARFPRYNYSVPAFREWWVECAVQSVQNSSGMLDGLFLDATPKVATSGSIDFWDSMVDDIRRALGTQAIVIDNGFYETQREGHLAGEGQWRHSGMAYAESLANVGTGSQSVSADIDHLTWISNSSANFTDGVLIGHGQFDSSKPTASFEYGLAKYLLVTQTCRDGYFLSNAGYSIDGGILEQPNMEFYFQHGAGCGEPLTPYFEIADRQIGTASHYLSL